VFAERMPKINSIVIDQSLATTQENTNQGIELCGYGDGNYSKHSFVVEKEMKFTLDQSDMTWIIFVSEPIEFICSYYDVATYIESLHLPPGVVNNERYSYFDLQALHPMKKGMVRLAMVNNCTTGQNQQYCERRQPRDQTAYEELLRTHADIYPTAKADVEFTFPTEESEEEELRLVFNWHPASMSHLRSDKPTYSVPSTIADPFAAKHEVLLFALPHHQERMRSTLESTNQVLTNVGCSPTLHGIACPVSYISKKKNEIL